VGPALLAQHGVFCIGGALSGDHLAEVQRRAGENTSEVLRVFALRQALAPLRPGDAQYREICCRDGGRYDIRFRMDEPPFPGLAEAGPWVDVVKAILGDDATLLFSGVVLATGNGDEGGTAGGGADAGGDQSWHTDGGHLHDEDGAGPQLPCHCLNVFVPLVPIHETNGATQFVLGTHRKDCTTMDSAAALLCAAGSAILFDYRCLHRGSANTTTEDRPVLYFTYAKPWFVDAKNHRSTRSILGVAGRGGERGRGGRGRRGRRGRRGGGTGGSVGDIT
jgi:hypothetical protein